MCRYSFGVFLFQLYGEDRTPFAHLNDQSFLTGLSGNTLPEIRMPASCPTEAQALITQCHLPYVPLLPPTGFSARVPHAGHHPVRPFIIVQWGKTPTLCT